LPNKKTFPFHRLAYSIRPKTPATNAIMPNRIRFVFALHNHQPVGNFDDVFQRAFEDSYRNFLDVFSR